MKKLLLAALSALGVAFAGTSGYSYEINAFVHTLEGVVGEGRVSVSCWDYVAWMSKTKAEARALGKQMRDESSTDSIMACEVSHLSGNPSFLPEMMDYVAGGFQYTVSQHYPYTGNVGRIRKGASAQFLIVLPGVKRTEPFMLYLRDDGVEAVLLPVGTGL